MNHLTFKTPARAARLVAATLFLGLAGAALQTAHAAPGGHGGMGMHGDMAHGGGRGMGMDGAGHFMGRMLDRVGASAEQKAQIKTIMEAARTELQPLKAQMKALQDRSAALFTQPTVDANAIEAVRVQKQAIHAQVSKRMQQAMLESSRVLTPEQRTRMADMVQKRRAMAERHRAEADSLMGQPAGAK